ncbi:MAG: GNAT family N-acetyltransferase [Burkholderiales bacterium]|nr:GNAT family N-acetyltransferase [Burkholderiales bacterium]
MNSLPDPWTLRPWRPGDEAALARAANDDRILRWMSDTWPEPYTVADAAWWVNEGSLAGSTWALCLKDVPQGGVGAHPQTGFQRCNVEVGWWLAPAHWGQGLVPLAARWLVEQALLNPEVTRVFAPIHAGNIPSGRVAEKIGMRLESVQPRSAIKRGTVIDRHLYALYRDPP